MSLSPDSVISGEGTQSVKWSGGNNAGPRFDPLPRHMRLKLNILANSY